MSTENVLDIILIRDGENLILRTKSEGLKIRMAFVDTNGAEGAGEGKITSIIQGQPTEAEVDSFLDMAKAQVEDFVQSGALDRERENFRLRNLLAEATSAQAARITKRKSVI